MATTCFFEETIRDKGEKGTMNLEFGRSSFYGENSLYIVVDGKCVIVDRETAKNICEQMNAVASYLGLVDN